MSTKGNIVWTPKKSKEHRKSRLDIKGILEPSEWQDFELALMRLGKDFGINITGSYGSKRATKKATKKAAKKAKKKATKGAARRR